MIDGSLSRHDFWRRLLPGTKKRPAFTPIVSEADVRSSALVVVIAIMTCLACLALAGVNLVLDSARSWQNQILREATIQILPAEGVDMDKALAEAVTIARSFGGVANARIVSRADTQQLLTPWFGAGFDLDALPVPRLVVLTLQTNVRPDFEGLRDALRQNVPTARFDDHHGWVDRLVSMAQGTVFAGVIMFLLVMAAMILTIVFATRGALSGNSHIVDVLHFIGADAGFIARQFESYFFRTGLKGAVAGGASALIIFFLVSLWLSSRFSAVESSLLAAVPDNLAALWLNLAEIFVLVMFVSILTMLTCRYTILQQLREIDRREGDFFNRAG